MLKQSRKKSRRTNLSRPRLTVKFIFTLVFGAILFGLITIYIVPIFSSAKPPKPAVRALASDLGINNGTGYVTDPAFVDRSIKHTKDLGLGIVRMGMDSVDGSTEGAPFNWSARDLVVKKYLNAGIKIHSVISARGHVNRDSNYAQWKANYRYFVRHVMKHYKGKIFYYIIDNEPEFAYANGPMSAQQCLDMTRIAYETAKSIDRKIAIESPPTKSPDSPLLGQMLDAGIAKYSDYIGIHAYGGQIHEGSFNSAWKALADRGVKKPIAISETGSVASWCPGSSAEKEDCRRRWFALFGQQLKRYGYDHALLFDLDSHDEWAIAPEFKPTKAYQQVKNLRLNQSLANTGFESKNNVESDWVPFNPNDIGSSPHVTFVRGDAAGAHSGNGYVKLEAGKAGSGTPINVRRIAGRLPTGKKVAIGAWAYVNGGGTTATLKALGYDNRNGDAEISKTATKKNGWQYLEIAVPISKYWTVIELGTEGTGRQGDYVKWDDVKIRNL